MSIDLIDTARPKNSGTFPIALATDLKGGLMQVADATARLAIPSPRLVDGLLVYQQNTGDIWKLGSDLSTWSIAQFQVAVSMSSNATLRVAASGGNDSDPNRPVKISGGDWSAYPFATPQAAVDSLLRETGGFYHRINCDAGTFAAGATVQGFTGGGIVDIVGDFANATLTSGANTGTAGSGTTTTAVKKPTAAADWTVDDLRGKILLLTGGGGYYADTMSNLILNSGPCLRVIKSNTVDTITVDAITGMNSTSTFRIVTVATLLGQSATSYGPITYATGLFGNSARVWLRNLKTNAGSALYGFFAQGNRLLEAYALDIAPTTFNGLGYYDTDNFTLKHAYAHGGSASHLDIYNGGRCLLSGIVLDNSRVQIDHWRRAGVLLDAKSCTGTAARFRHSSYVFSDVKAVSCTTTPVVLVNCNRFEPNNTGLQGSNPSAAYGVAITGGGVYVLTGTTIAGAADLSFDGKPVTWSDLAVRNHFNGSAFALWADWKMSLDAQVRINNISSDNFDNLQTSSLQVEDYMKFYAALRALPTSDVGSGDYSSGAYAEVVAHAGGGQANAVIIGTQLTKIKTVATTGDSTRFFSDTEKGGTGFGTYGQIWNMGANDASHYPQSGQKIVFNGSDLGTNNAATLKAGKRYSWFTDSAGVWYLDGP